MNHSWKTRFLAMLLTVVMVVGYIPTSAFATYGAETQEHTHESHVAELSEEPSEAPAEEPADQTDVHAIVADMQTVLDICGLTAASTDAEMLDAIYSTQDETVPELIEEIWWACQDVSESEAATLTEAEIVTVETYARLMAVMETDESKANYSSHTVVTGVTANVSGSNSESFSGGTLTVTAKGSEGFLGIGASARTTTITITNDTGSDGILSFNWKATNVNSLTIDGASYSGSGGFTKQLANGGSFQIVITTAKNSTENKLEMSNFQFQQAVESSKVTFVYDESLGSVTVGGEAVANNATMDVAYDTGAALVATPKDGSKFLGWVKADDHSVISKEATYTLQVAADTTVQAVFANAASPAWFDASGFLFDNLNDAVTKGGTVVLASDGVLEAGDYTIPSGVTLLIPFDDANTLYTSEPGYDSTKDSTYSAPKAYRTLTMKNGANLIVNGGMSLSAKFFIAQGGRAECGAPTGNVSFVRMETGSAITVNNGGSLYAWGFITGDGSVTANSGANVYENFQFTDFRGGTQSTSMKNGVFPISQYYIQNIEVPLTLHTGAKETGYTGLYMSKTNFPSSVNFFGQSDCMFCLTSGYLVKRYDGASDRLVIDVYGDVSVAGIKLKVGFASISSSNYELPLNSNITVNIKSGTVTFGQNLAMLPGSKVVIDEGATLKLANGISVYVYDGDDWGNFCGSTNQQFIPIKYAPGKTYTRTAADLTDVTVQVAGTLDASAGYLYTTAGGADICGVGNGTVKINPGTATVTYQLVQGTGNTQIPVTSAKLKNADGTYTETAGTAKTYEYNNGAWTSECVHNWADATCTAPKTCTLCGATEGEAKGHTEVIDAAVAATCTATGLTEGKHCSVCGEVLVAQTVVPATGHTEVIDKAVAATCTATGLTEGKHCSVCNTVLVAQTETPAIGHSFGEWVVTQEATCTEEGQERRDCANCDHYETRKVDALGHTEVVDAAVAPTCTATGLTEGKHCSVCNEVLVAQTVVPVADHKYENGKCTVCGEADPGEAAASIGEENYLTLAEAINAAKDGETVKLLQNVSISSQLNINKAITLDGNGKTITRVPTETGKTTVKAGILVTAAATIKNLTVSGPNKTQPGWDSGEFGIKFYNAEGAELIDCKVTGANAGIQVNGGSVTMTGTIDLSGNEFGGMEVCHGAKLDISGATLVNEEETANCPVLWNDDTKGEIQLNAAQALYIHAVEADKDHYYVTEANAAHTVVIDEAVAATCTETGLTEGKHCSVCGEVLVAQTVVDALGHTEVVDAAVAPTCTATGLTEGKHCSVCGEVLVAQTVVDALGHTKVVDAAVDPTCTKTGLTAGTHCSVCGETLVAQTVVPATGHTEVIDAAVDATCTETGLTEGKHCSVCNEVLVAQEVIPALGHNFDDPEPYIVWETEKTEGSKTYKCQNEGCTQTKVTVLPIAKITDFQSFVANLQILELLAEEYVKENPGSDPATLVIKYIRTGVDRYNSGSWGIMAGYENSGFEKYVRKMEQMANEQAESEGSEERICVTGLKNIENFTLPNGDNVDFGHMFGAMDITWHNNGSVNHADVAGWAGDLVDLLSAADRHGVTGTLDEMIADIRQNYLGSDLDGEDDKFSQTDIYGDLDAFYIISKLSEGKYAAGKMTEIIGAYFTESLSDVDRADYLLKNRFDGASTRDAVREAVYEGYIANKLVSTLEGTRTFNTEDLVNLRKACCYAFADYLCQLAGDYVDVTDNTYYSVYYSKSSTLAPGITQEIKKATTSDGKNMNYFLATADITRSDVSVYANYNENDPSLGWKMSRVMDQAYAAEQRHSDPESASYIPNYNVIAGINGSGFNMSTGEPSGLLIMEGIEYHPVDANGFFAILKSGKAVIGTMEDYDTYQDQIQEAIAGFGCVLIRDGKVAVNRTDNYYSDRANRTAVGITKTGKVVFMVLDGRQAASCGGSMQEIAQIMLEAGCVEAINLDGGGSTTFIAQQEGDEQLSVVNSPSDGYARSVSNSLIMVSTAASSTAFDHALISSAAEYMTQGSVMQMTAKGVSATGNAAELPEDAKWAVTNTLYATIDENGVLTALRNYGEATVQLKSGDEVIGETVITLCDPDKVAFARDKIDVVYGQSVELPVKAYYQGKAVAFNAADIRFTLSADSAGTIEGLTFTAAESKIRQVTVTAALAKNSEAKASISVSLYNQGENSFDFDQAIGGDRMLAWDRKVSNTTTEDNTIYTVVDPAQPMVTAYTFAMDMTQIPIPEQLSDLVYMLPGADLEDASAWTFLLQLAERVSTLTEVKVTIDFDDAFDVDYSNVTLVNEYFVLKEKVFDEKTNTLTLTLGWIKQTAAIDPASANPLCMLNGIKVTPKADADWGAQNRINAVTKGAVSYKVYLRANALYSFAQKEENQKIYGLMPYVNPDDSSDAGAYFGDTYKEIEDTYTLVSAAKEGWINETGGFAYYKDGEKLTGVQLIDGYYYDFGEDGINKGQTKLTGLFYDESVKAYRYAKFGELVGGWHEIDGKYHYFKSYSKVAATGTYTVNGVTYQFDETGKTEGAWHTTDEGTRYYYGGSYYRATNPGYMKLVTINGKTYNFDNSGYLTYGIQALRASTAYEKYVYEFGEDGALIREIKEEQIIEIDGAFYYISSKGYIEMNAGLFAYNGDYYYTVYSGKLKQNGNAPVTEENVAKYPDLKAGTYYFGDDCKMVIPEEKPSEPTEPEVKNGIYQEGDIKVYYKDGVKQKNLGLIKVDGDYYYVCYSGKLKQNGNQTITEAHVAQYPDVKPGVYYFGNDCKMVVPETEPTVKNGIYQEDGIYVYYVDGVKQTNLGLIQIDGAYYYVCYSGKLKQNGNQTITEAHTAKYPGVKPGVYYFGDDCKMQMK